MFYWVNPLISKGRRGLIRAPEDVFDLPRSLYTPILSQSFGNARAALGPTSSVGRVLAKLFWGNFLAVGVLKFIADLSGFASPMLLNLLVSFMENKEKEAK